MTHSADNDAAKPCIGTEPHRPHLWHGYPPDVWRCPGVRLRLNEAEVSLLAEAFGGASPSELLIRRVERIIEVRTCVIPPEVTEKQAP